MGMMDHLIFYADMSTINPVNLCPQTYGSYNGTGTGIDATNIVRGVGGGMGTHYNGSDESTNMGDVLDIGDNDWSVAAFFKTSSVPANYTGIAGKPYYGSGAGRYGLFINTTGEVGFVTQSTLTGTLTALSANQYKDGAWHLALGVLDRDVGAYIYVDGELQGSDLGDTSGDTFNTTDNFTIGEYNGGARFFNGVIDEVTIFNTVLTQLQAISLERDIRTGRGI